MIWFSLVGTVVPPLIGIMGTITALEDSLSDLGTRPGTDLAVVSNGISLSLLTTAGSALLSLPFMVLLVVSCIFCIRAQRS